MGEQAQTSAGDKPMDHIPVVGGLQELQVQLGELFALSPEVIDDIKVSLMSGNPLDQAPSLSRPVRKKYPGAGFVLQEQMERSDYPVESLLAIGGNPVIQTLVDKRSALKEISDKRGLGEFAHQELSDTIVIAAKIILWEIKHGVYDPLADDAPLSWPSINRAIEHRISLSTQR